ncbi:DUF1287 domain-containing protein [Flavobacterium akiainvivens]|uniref:DUF1287 domain-containing protein n=1 Tax=Flavobacterium akiainvivens TaxID=1202724 RepID=UPI0008ECFF21|nr:DUF1287 domain-containing protein [Flavobacterium akiainvivens]SFQ13271.1 hypothetical protein SAMN05444144_101224 [Flavobacterium akiainvivens]
MKYLLLLFLLACAQSPTANIADNQAPAPEKDFYGKLSDAALQLTENEVEYDPTYYKIPYPNGDVPKGKGVCTDVIIRAYRALNIDLQKEVHEDMAANFSKYPKAWGLKAPDTNIDHRRVPNLQVFFTRKGESMAITTKASNYKVGDIVTWMLPANHPHVGIVVDKKGADGRYKVVHNIGSGQNLDDCLFDWKITGHYRYKK